jgi:hypothetical protein
LYSGGCCRLAAPGQVLRQVAARVAVAAVDHHERLEVQRVAAVELVGQARRQVQAAGFALGLVEDVLVLGDHAIAAGVAVVGGGVVVLVVLGDGAGQQPRQAAGLARHGQRNIRRVAALLDGVGQLELVVALLVAVAQDDVDGAGNRPRAVLGHRAAHDFNPFHLVRRQRLHREAGRRPFAIEQDLRVAAAHAAHAHIAAAAGTAAQRHARQALEHVAEVAVAVAVQLFAAVDLLARHRIAALGHVVGAAAADGDLLDLLVRCLDVRLLRRIGLRASLSRAQQGQAQPGLRK